MCKYPVLSLHSTHPFQKILRNLEEKKVPASRLQKAATFERRSNIHFENKGSHTVSEVKYTFEKKFKCPFGEKESQAQLKRTRTSGTLKG